MDASDSGLCALNPARREYLRVHFTDAEKGAIKSGRHDYSINVRELKSAVLAALHWGPTWERASSTGLTHVRLHIDNMAAVAWSNRRISRQPMDQLFNRLLSLAELQYQLVLQYQQNIFPDESMTWRTRDHGHGLVRTHSGTLGLTLTYLHHGHRCPFYHPSTISPQYGVILCEQALAGTTTTKYSAAWKQWSRFSHMMRWSPWLSAVGASSGTKLGYFATYLWYYGWNSSNRGNHYSTVETKISSVIWYHKRYQNIDVVRSPGLRVLLQGIKRMSDSIRKKYPVTPSFLRLLRRSLTISRPRHRLLWDSVLLAYFFLLRRSEFLVVDQRRSSYCLKDQNVFFSDGKGLPVSPKSASAVTIGLDGAKNDQYGRGAWRTMHASGDRQLCPVRALRHVKMARKQLERTMDEYLCLDLNSAVVAKALKDVAIICGVPPIHYATHSLRIGGATALLNGKADSLSVKLLGRWASRCYEEYPVQSAAATVGLAGRMVAHHWWVARPTQGRVRPFNWGPPLTTPSICPS